MKITIILILLALSIVGYTQTPQTYDYLTMVQRDNTIKITLGSDKFETIDIKDEKSTDAHDFRPLIKRIEQYQLEGWEIVANNVYLAGFATNYLLMRRKK